ncbi:MAG: PDZ domain-containing protein [Chthoniobacterales bacterium]|nr:PDZ domain-containing protein [Chthoniobacterales bacterium]
MMKAPVFMVAVITVAVGILTTTSASAASTQAPVFGEVWQTVKDNFFDPALNGVDWEAARERYRKEAEAAGSPDAFAAVVNRMLSELKTSHTRYYTAREPEYYQLAGIFWPFASKKLKPFLRGGTPRYVGIGVSTAEVEGKTFVRAVFDGLPAAAAGVRVGDQILDVDENPFHAIGSFSAKENQPVQMRVQRTPDAASTTVVTVTPKSLDPATMFLEAMKASVQVIEESGTKVGYVHIWSYAGETYQEQLEDELSGRLREADGLILDLRDGWGGANPNYLWPFVAPPLTMTSIGRDGKRTDYRTGWSKPVCLLVNEGSKSGKEVLAYYFRKARRGMIVGSRTAGAVMAGRPFVMSDGSVLYLAVNDGLLDGTRPEGNPVVPDLEVPFPIPYAEGGDPQKTAAIAAIVKAVRGKQPSP